jgi:hypothetical protein
MAVSTAATALLSCSSAIFCSQLLAAVASILLYCCCCRDCCCFSNSSSSKRCRRCIVTVAVTPVAIVRRDTIVRVSPQSCGVRSDPRRLDRFGSWFRWWTVCVVESARSHPRDGIFVAHLADGPSRPRITCARPSCGLRIAGSLPRRTDYQARPRTPCKPSELVIFRAPPSLPTCCATEQQQQPQRQPQQRQANKDQYQQPASSNSTSHHVPTPLFPPLSTRLYRSSQPLSNAPSVSTKEIRHRCISAASAGTIGQVRLIRPPLNRR